MLLRHFSLGIAAAGLLLATAPANATPTTYGGVTFPQGDISFADQVVSYSVGTGGVDAANQVATNALGIPNFNSVADTGYVSLGSGGTIILKFTDNFLTGSDDTADDLYIFEIGSAVESTLVWVSTDGNTWDYLDKIAGSTRGVDLDAYGFGSADKFSFVKLQDDPSDTSTGYSAGADIDAVGAISTVRQIPPTGAPEPATLALFGAGVAGLGFLRRKRRKA